MSPALRGTETRKLGLQVQGVTVSHRKSSDRSGHCVSSFDLTVCSQVHTTKVKRRSVPPVLGREIHYSEKQVGPEVTFPLLLGGPHTVTVESEQQS